MSDDTLSGSELHAAAVRGLRWSVVARPLIELVLLASMVALARLITPADFGRFAVALAVTELAILIPSEGVGTALVQRKSVTRAHLQSGMALALLASVVVAALTLVLATVLITPLFGVRTADFVRLSTPGFLLAGLSAVPMALLRRRLAFRQLTFVDLGSTLTRAGVSLALAVAGLEGESLILGGLAAGVVVVAMAWAWAPAPFPRLLRSAARDILSYGLPASLASVSWVGFRNCDYAIVGARLGVLQAGYYFRAYNLAVEYQKKISLVMGQVGFPLLARAGSATEMLALQAKMVRLITTLLFPLLALLAILAPVAVPWIFGPAWEPAVVPTQILALGGASTLVIDAAGAALMASGRARALLGYGVAHFACYALIVLVVTPFGIVGVALGASIVHTIFLVIAYDLMLRGSTERALPRLWQDLHPALGACLALVAVAVPVNALATGAGAPAALQLAVVSIIGTSAYLVALRLCFAQSWRALISVFRQVLPERARWPIPRRPAPALGTGGSS
ncbi:MAG TPA: oligosaccharide flippase family protein [Thermoleophilia bacterium]